eukprot:TRINITY_DN10873_c0_g1_i1.p1 TRINITY_DN10873_c0_g1~~TRINITY_DN10873_c0_g1_i1.p1  ORF type:complete len:648 (-),score=140.39 TRINITY_DN10873_c0_g1_i1:354-2297(-)
MPKALPPSSTAMRICVLLSLLHTLTALNRALPPPTLEFKILPLSDEASNDLDLSDNNNNIINGDAKANAPLAPHAPHALVRPNPRPNARAPESSGRLLGHSIALSSHWIVVGQPACQHSTAPCPGGRIYIYARPDINKDPINKDPIKERAKDPINKDPLADLDPPATAKSPLLPQIHSFLTNPTRRRSAHFGIALQISLDERWLLVAAKQASDTPASGGVVHVFRRDLDEQADAGDAKIRGDLPGMQKDPKQDQSRLSLSSSVSSSSSSSPSLSLYRWRRIAGLRSRQHPVDHDFGAAVVMLQPDGFPGPVVAVSAPMNDDGAGAIYLFAARTADGPFPRMPLRLHIDASDPLVADADQDAEEADQGPDPDSDSDLSQDPVQSPALMEDEYGLPDPYARPPPTSGASKLHRSKVTCLGYAMAGAKDWLAIAAMNPDRVVVYRYKQDWRRVQILHNPYRGAFYKNITTTRLVLAASPDAKWLLVGSPNGAGSVRVFMVNPVNTRLQGTQVLRPAAQLIRSITMPQVQDLDPKRKDSAKPVLHAQFGCNIAVHQERMLIGTCPLVWPGHESKTAPMKLDGPVVFYRFLEDTQTWQVAATIFPDSTVAKSYSAFGRSLSVSNDLALIASSREQDQDDGYPMGAVYAFRWP